MKVGFGNFSAAYVTAYYPVAGLGQVSSASPRLALLLHSFDLVLRMSHSTFWRPNGCYAKFKGVWWVAGQLRYLEIATSWSSWAVIHTYGRERNTHNNLGWFQLLVDSVTMESDNIETGRSAEYMAMSMSGMHESILCISSLIFLPETDVMDSQDLTRVRFNFISPTI